MKKTLLKGLAIATIALSANSAFAEISGLSLSSGVQSIEDGMQLRAKVLQLNALGLKDDSDNTAYLVVVNFTGETIQAAMPDQKRILTFHTMASYFESDHGAHKKYHIELLTAGGVSFWSGDVIPRNGHAPHDLIAVHGAYPKYVVYDTP